MAIRGCLHRGGDNDAGEGDRGRAGGAARANRPGVRRGLLPRVPERGDGGGGLHEAGPDHDRDGEQPDGGAAEGAVLPVHDAGEPDAVNVHSVGGADEVRGERDARHADRAMPFSIPFPMVGYVVCLSSVTLSPPSSDQ